MTLLLANSQAIWLFIAGIALLTWVLLKRSYRYFGRHKRHGNSEPLQHLHRPVTEWDGAQRDVMAQIERQKVEMQEMTRDLNGQLNSKIIILEKLISDSQRQIDRLEHLLGEAEETTKADLHSSSVD